MLARWLLLIVLLTATWAGAAAVLTLIAMIVLVSFLIAAANASPRPADSRLAPGAMAVLWLREIASAWLVILVFMPFERWLMRRDVAAGRSGLAPVLLIHGYVNNAGAMFILWRAIKDAGHAVHTVNLEPLYADIDRYAARIEARLAAIQAAAGGQAVMLVCHSMGGLAARAYLRKYGAARVERLITLGTPHAGTVLANTALGENGRQMRPGSAWLAGLAHFEDARWPCKVVAIYSHDDNIVAPQLSGRLEGAHNIALSGLGHISLPMSGAVAAQVVAEIAGSAA